MISVVIPHIPSEFHDELLKRCIDSLSGYDELIVVTNQPGTIGFTKAVNIGLKLAKGDYIMVVNNDIVWERGNLKDLCKPNSVTSPMMKEQPQFFWGCFFVVPREVLDKVGYLDEQFFLYCSDTDYVKRCREAKIAVESVQSCNVFTEGAQTTQTLPDRKKNDDADTAKFLSKWGMMPDQIMSLCS